MLTVKKHNSRTVKPKRHQNAPITLKQGVIYSNKKNGHEAVKIAINTIVSLTLYHEMNDLMFIYTFALTLRLYWKFPLELMAVLVTLAVVRQQPIEKLSTTENKCCEES